jgi:hypothetical protein
MKPKRDNSRIPIDYDLVRKLALHPPEWTVGRCARCARVGPWRCSGAVVQGGIFKSC